MRIAKIFAAAGVALLALMVHGLVHGAAFAQAGLEGVARVGKPTPQGMGFQTAGTEVARDLQWLDGMVLTIITAITIFVVLLILVVLVRYNRRANKTPSTFTHNSAVEVFWTLGPILILIVIGSFSLPILFKQVETPKADVSISITGNQWFWTYEYADNGFGFDSFLLAKDELADAGYTPDEYLLAVDAPLVVPVNKTVVLTITGADVIHSWAVPAFGVKLDAVPGRFAKTWFKAEKEGLYFGQCSELCGKDHAFMPIAVKVVSQEEYDAWLKSASEEFAGTSAQALTVASN